VPLGLCQVWEELRVEHDIATSDPVTFLLMSGGGVGGGAARQPRQREHSPSVRGVSAGDVVDHGFDELLEL
jgi:hypothetical protein